MTKYRNIMLLYFSLSILVVSCATYMYNGKNPYPNMETVRYENSQAYAIPHETSDTLIIVIEGSGWESALGEKQHDTWIMTHLAAQLLQELGNRYTFLIPEKLKRQPGLVYIDDMEDRANYTAENLIACYSESINSYLSEYVFSSIVLVATSEGALLIPSVYEKMTDTDKEKIIALVSISAGGLSLYESYSILVARSDLPPGYYETYINCLNLYSPENKEFRNTFEEDFYGMTFRWFNSMKNIRPFDFYKKIDIPILFVHGGYDFLVPVESTIYIQENLPEKPFEYKYFKWDHQPGNRLDMLQYRKEIAEWIMSKVQ